MQESNLCTELVDLAVLVSCNDELPQRPPHGTGYLVLTAGYGLVGLVVLCRHTKKQTYNNTTKYTDG